MTLPRPDAMPPRVVADWSAWLRKPLETLVFPPPWVMTTPPVVCALAGLMAIAAIAAKATKPARSMERMESPPDDPNPCGPACSMRRNLPGRSEPGCEPVNIHGFFEEGAEGL